MPYRRTAIRACQLGGGGSATECPSWDTPVEAAGTRHGQGFLDRDQLPGTCRKGTSTQVPPPVHAAPPGPGPDSESPEPNAPTPACRWCLCFARGASSSIVPFRAVHVPFFDSHYADTTHHTAHHGTQPDASRNHWDSCEALLSRPPLTQLPYCLATCHLPPATCYQQPATSSTVVDPPSPPVTRFATARQPLDLE